LEDIAAEYTTLKRRGNRYVGLCPFHSEKTPSFGVDASKQLYHCFGCGKGGGVIQFVMDSENLSFTDAVHYLAKRLGLTVPEDGESRSATAGRQRMLAALTDAAKWFHAQLKTDPFAREYLQKRRIEWSTAVRFGLGYAPEGWSALSEAMKQRGYTQAELFDAGLAVKGRNGGFRDKFYNRLMFPVIDQKGQVIAFGGRVIGDGEPKYLNSPEILNVFSKRRVLYGINLAKNTKRDYFILCEGNIDVITLHQAGFDNAVASMGTSLTQEQIALMTQYNIKEVVVCYDSDNAGIKATERAIEELDKRGITLGVVRVPDGKDVDDFIKAHGAAAFESLLDKRDDDVSYRLNRLESGYDFTKEEQRADYLRKVLELFAELDSVRREIYAPRVAKAAQVSVDFITRESEKSAVKLHRERRKKEQKEAVRPVQTLQSDIRRTGIRYGNPRSAIAEEGVIRVLLANPELINGLALSPDEFTAPELGRIFTLLLRRYADGLPIEPAKLAGELSVEEVAVITRICGKEEILFDSAANLNDYIHVIRMEKVSGSLEQLIAFKKEQIDRED
jgi:DNA primase